jgi:hypothetical protein
MPGQAQPPRELREEIYQRVSTDAMVYAYALICDLFEDEKLLNLENCRLDIMERETQSILENFYYANTEIEARESAFERSVALMQIWCPWLVQIHDRMGTDWIDIYLFLNGDGQEVSLPEELEEILLDSWKKFQDDLHRAQCRECA